jgi:hypothetical protein
MCSHYWQINNVSAYLPAVPKIYTATTVAESHRDAIHHHGKARPLISKRS